MVIDFEPWHQLLGEYVTPKGQVDYQRWKGDVDAIAQLQDWLVSLQTTELSALPQNTQLALLINLYNALTINQVLGKYPIDSVRPSIMGMPNLASFKLFFSKPVYQLGVQKLSLDGIEHDLLRRQFSEPRIHFALVCASISCPQLRNEAYRPETISHQLDDAAQQFINDPEKNRYDGADNILYCSKIFQWYEKDFLSERRSIVEYFQKYSQQQISADAAIEYLPYDWRLNKL